VQNTCGQGMLSGVGGGCYEDHYLPSTSLVRAPVCCMDRVNWATQQLFGAQCTLVYNHC
jgi:hypothetical protein